MLSIWRTEKSLLDNFWMHEIATRAKVRDAASSQEEQARADKIKKTGRDMGWGLRGWGEGKILANDMTEFKKIIWTSISQHLREFPDGSVAKTLCSQCRELGFDPWSGNCIPCATAKCLHAATKDPMGHN